MDLVRADIYTGVLALLKCRLPCIVKLDYSAHRLEAVHIQLYEGKEQPIQLAFCMLVEDECEYAPIEGEALAILFALYKFLHLLMGE